MDFAAIDISAAGDPEPTVAVIYGHFEREKSDELTANEANNNYFVEPIGHLTIQAQDLGPRLIGIGIGIIVPPRDLIHTRPKRTKLQSTEREAG